MRQTSIRAYNEIKQELGRRQAEVLKALETLRNASDKELARELGRPINSITPRRNELVKKGLVEEHRREPCSVTGRKVIKWRVKR